ncbi:MAG: hypothetical protein QOC81_3018 [Thermoanaerobaculia bacterium]|jgi:hypothetical protein|nr:hypothetical protein [Thermoanaerobaculia bacterium]
MTDGDPVDSAEDQLEPASPKLPWQTPKIETFGTIADLTRGAGQDNNFDGAVPPGQNKSRL